MLLNAQEIGEEGKWVALEIVLHVQVEHLEKRLKNGSFSPEMDHCMAPRRGRCLIEHPFAIVSHPNG